jgi:hypothetical protein
MINKSSVTTEITTYAKKLRVKDNLREVPDDRPGWYRWWASPEALKLLLNSAQLTRKYYDELLPHLQKQTGKNSDWHSLYVGVAIKESIRRRLNWHINQEHTESCVKHGTLSTLRQSISSLVAGNQYDEDATNKLIDMLVVEYTAVALPIGSEKARQYIERIELEEMNNTVFPLNIKDNHQPEIQGFKRELSRIRKNSKKEV